jgi:hypothetical protein
MKKLMTAMLALSFLVATVGVSFAQEKKEEPTKPMKKKGGKKKTEPTKSGQR